MLATKKRAQDSTLVFGTIVFASCRTVIKKVSDIQSLAEILHPRQRFKALSIENDVQWRFPATLINTGHDPYHNKIKARI
jgi:hypothetical protein